MSILQLDPLIPVFVKPFDRCPGGKGMAHLVIDNGIEFSLQWVVFLDSCGECWTATNENILAQKNITLGRLMEIQSMCQADHLSGGSE